jgi:ParB/RepB/Spo0J family partition protein
VTEKLEHVLVSSLSPHPLNPRASVDPAAMESLIASIEAQGIIEPLIVRPENTGFQIVCGERRYLAAKELGHETVPAIVRDLSDEEAFNVMVVENLQREDISEYDEAVSFAAYIKKNGVGGNLILAEKIGVSPRYIRSRAAVMNLPEKILKAWAKGRLTFAHLEQFLRVTDPEELKALQEWTFGQAYNEIESAEAMKAWISDRAIPLTLARWDIAETCGACRSNSKVQRDLFGVGDKGAKCSLPACFRVKQVAWFMANWAASPLRKKYKTNGAVFCDDKRELRGWADAAPAKCLDCPSFVTVLQMNSEVFCGQACAGDESCRKALEAAAKKARAEKVKAEIGAGGKAATPDARVVWHGELFRQTYFRKIAATRIASFGGTDRRRIALLLALLATKSGAVKASLEEEMPKKPGAWASDAEVIKAFASVPIEDLIRMATKAIIAMVVDGEFKSGRDTGELKPASRRAIFEQILGIDLAHDWVPDAEYFGKKTIGEIGRFIFKHRLDRTEPGKSELKKRGKSIAEMKKAELVDFLTNSGLDLAGKVPAEILAESEK